MPPIKADLIVGGHQEVRVVTPSFFFIFYSFPRVLCLSLNKDKVIRNDLETKQVSHSTR